MQNGQNQDFLPFKHDEHSSIPSHLAVAPYYAYINSHVNWFYNTNYKK